MTPFHWKIIVQLLLLLLECCSLYSCRRICKGYDSKQIEWKPSDKPVPKLYTLFHEKNITSLENYVFIRETYEHCTEIDQHLVISNVDENELGKNRTLYDMYLKVYNVTELNFDFLNSIEIVGGSVIIEFCQIETLPLKNLRTIRGNYLENSDARLNIGFFVGHRSSEPPHCEEIRKGNPMFDYIKRIPQLMKLCVGNGTYYQKRDTISVKKSAPKNS